jgi:hypothetical protein
LLLGPTERVPSNAEKSVVDVATLFDPAQL